MTADEPTPRDDAPSERRKTGFVEDLKGVPDDVRDAVQDADRHLTEQVDEKPALGRALDFKVVLVALGVALVAALLVRLLGASVLISFALFVLLAAGIWVGLARASAPRRATETSEASETSEKSEAAGAPESSETREPRETKS